MVSSENKLTQQCSCAAGDTFVCRFCDALISRTWHHGFTKKCRTPRDKNREKHAPMITFNPLPVVPNIDTNEPNTMNSDEQFNYQVPVFDPFSSEWFPLDTNHTESNGLTLPLDSELADFAADDMERLLGKSHNHEDVVDDKALGMVGCRLNEPVKVEDENFEVVCDDHMNMHTEILYNSIRDTRKKTSNMLKLDHDGIIACWDDERSPWTTGDRPELDPDDCWPDCMAHTCLSTTLDLLASKSREAHERLGSFTLLPGVQGSAPSGDRVAWKYTNHLQAFLVLSIVVFQQVGCEEMRHCDSGDKGMITTRLDAGREARVSRYKKKRQTRLFSKKIRYEVRKLNAEKRPRMKGRFVKRTSFAA